MMKKWTGGEIWPSWNSPKENPSFKEGSSIKGVYSQKKAITTDMGQNNVYGIDTGKGNMQGIWGSKILDDFFSNAAFGTTVEITFLGKKKGKAGRMFNAYDISFDDSTAIADSAGKAAEVFDK